MKCGECDLWAHKRVQGLNAGRSSVIFVNKTGVAHFILQFWHLNKLVIFCMSVLHYFQCSYTEITMQSVVKILNCVIKQTLNC